MELGLGEKNHDQTRELLAGNSFDQIIASVHYLEDTDPYFAAHARPTSANTTNITALML